ncbi:hypothetical protein [Rhodococcus sp. 06-235-1A]|uniref:hypothetical protein n=1 Tax=Rhodococcus sp. 06-235-1A TaxID=2022508 RepID=UPI00117BB102|nr:hypothetical protein [Rhodococcus sp. 06-235-1A]
MVEVMIGPQPEVPDIRTAGEFCLMVSSAMSRVANIDYAEPHVDIHSFDLERGTTEFPDPLLTTHRLGKFYLLCGGDFVHTIGLSLLEEQPKVVSPAVLARSAAEYSSRSWYISDPEDTVDTRLAKMIKLVGSGLAEAGFSDPRLDPVDAQFASGFNRWVSQQKQLPKLPKPNYKKLIELMVPEIGGQEYDALSGYVHASAVTVIGAVIGVQLELNSRRLNAWKQVAFATLGGISAASRMELLRTGSVSQEVSELSSAWRQLVHSYESVIDRVLPSDGARIAEADRAFRDQFPDS